MSDELRQIVTELSEIKKLLASVLLNHQDVEAQANHQAELQLVDSMGLDPVQYLKGRTKNIINLIPRKTPARRSVK